jgi:hypothetical protein
MGFHASGLQEISPPRGYPTIDRKRRLK